MIFLELVLTNSCIQIALGKLLYYNWYFLFKFVSNYFLYAINLPTTFKKNKFYYF